MPTPFAGLAALAVVIIATVISAILGSLVVYVDAQRRDEDRQMLWTGVTGVGFLFGLIPGVLLIISYFIVSRKL